MEKSEINTKTPQRLMSVDALRGFDMFFIIGGSWLITGFVQALGGPVEFFNTQFEHVKWEGIHFEDLIWPLFMFLVGVSIPLSIAKRKASGTSNRSLYLHALRRVAILFILGMVVQGGLLKWDISKLHPFYSVLHGIAVGYLIAVIVVIELKPKMQAAIIPIFLIVSWALIELIPVPGVGAGVLTTDGNAAIWIDRLWQGGFHFGENTWLLSYMGFASSVLLGSMAGHLLMSARDEKKKVMMLAGLGAACVIVGFLWGLVFPIIKLLWTGSFVLVGGGFGFLMLALFYWIIDVKGYRRWAFFFTVIGMNSIFAYVGTALISFGQIGNVFVGGFLPAIQPWDKIVSSLASVTVLWLVLYWMYRTKSFVKV